jgi:hypothetical protein
MLLVCQGHMAFTLIMALILSGCVVSRWHWNEIGYHQNFPATNNKWMWGSVIVKQWNSLRYVGSSTNDCRSARLQEFITRDYSVLRGQTEKKLSLHTNGLKGGFFFVYWFIVVIIIIIPLGRQSCRWEDNIKMDLQEVRYRGMGWIDLAHERGKWRTLVNAVMNLRVP